MQSSAAGDAGPVFGAGVTCWVGGEVFGGGLFLVAMFLVVGGLGGGRKRR